MRKTGPKVDPDQFIAAVEACRAGTSAREVARILGVSPPTVIRWVKLAKEGKGPDGEPTGPAVPPGIAPERLAAVVSRRAHDAPHPDPDPDTSAGASLRERVDATIRRLEQVALKAEQDPAGPNWTAVKSALKAAADAMPLLARLESAERASAEVLVLPLEELKAADDLIDARYDALLRVPVYCARCQARVKTEREAAAGYRPNPEAR
jgi:transposase-like protein